MSSQEQRLIQICSQTPNFLLARGEAGEASLTPTRLLERFATPYQTSRFLNRS